MENRIDANELHERLMQFVRDAHPQPLTMTNARLAEEIGVPVAAVADALGALAASRRVEFGDKPVNRADLQPRGLRKQPLYLSQAEEDALLAGIAQKDEQARRGGAFGKARRRYDRR